MAGPIPQEVIAEVRERNDIVQVISEYVKLKRAGKNWVGLCPFHQEKTPSFTVNQEEQFYYCFGCGAGGNVVSFLMQIENLPFVAAVEKLAERAGISIVRRDLSPAEKRKQAEREKLLRLHEVARDFFCQNLNSAAGARARNYLASRGVEDKIAQRFKLGYALPQWQSLLLHLQKEGFTTAECLSAGLVLEGQKSRPYDRFRGRLMFPICNWRGQPIGFGGRVLDTAQPKYLNSPETLLFNKRNTLYGLDLARASCRERGYAIIVEGYMDVIGLHQAGYSNTVAALGTALTETQARLIKRFVNEVIIAFDGDAAGEAATWRGLELLHRQGLRVRVLELPSGEDPDTFVRRYGGAALQELVDKAAGLIDFKLHTILRHSDLSTVDGKVAAMSRIIEVLAEVDSPVERDEYLRQAAAGLKVSMQALVAELAAYEEKAGIESRSRHRISSKSHNKIDASGGLKGRIRGKQSTGGKSQVQGLRIAGLSAIERNLLRLLLHEGHLLDRVRDTLRPEYFRHPVARKAMESLLACYTAGQVTGGAVFDFVEDESVRELLRRLLAVRTSLPPPQACLEYVKKLQAIQLRDDLQRLEAQIGQVEVAPVGEDPRRQLDGLLIKYRQTREEIGKAFSQQQESRFVTTTDSSATLHFT